MSLFCSEAPIASPLTLSEVKSSQWPIRPYIITPFPLPLWLHLLRLVLSSFKYSNRFPSNHFLPIFAKNITFSWRASWFTLFYPMKFMAKLSISFSCLLFLLSTYYHLIHYTFYLYFFNWLSSLKWKHC